MLNSMWIQSVDQCSQPVYDLKLIDGSKIGHLFRIHFLRDLAIANTSKLHLELELEILKSKIAVLQAIVSLSKVRFRNFQNRYTPIQPLATWAKPRYLYQ